MQPFVVNINSLGTGVKTLSAVADKQFFDSFENGEILDASVNVELSLRSRGGSVDVICKIKGSLTVPCDLCLEPVSLEVESGFEDSYIPEGVELDLSQDVYDYIITALPMRRVHPEGECNAETTKYLSK
ncbi:MAG: YceD family protein [Candidatus Cryptobacteroides sp.]